MSITLSPAYQPCAVENGTCTFTGTQSVAYTAPGATSSIFYRNLSNGTPCNDTIFNDPSAGNQKSCYTAPIPADVLAGGSNFYDTNGNPTGWTKCADQGNVCNPGVNTPVDILYGAGGSFIYANATSTPCSNEIFSDPKVGSTKACYWRNPVTPNGPAPTPNSPPSTTSNKNLYIGLGIGGGLILLIIIIVMIVSMRK